MYRTSLQCRFLTAIRLPDDSSDIPEKECEEMLNEYLDLLKSFITTNSYFVVDDALDSLVCMFDELLASKKKGLVLTRLIKDARHKTVLFRKHNEKRLAYPDLFFFGPEPNHSPIYWIGSKVELSELLVALDFQCFTRRERVRHLPLQSFLYQIVTN